LIDELQVQTFVWKIISCHLSLTKYVFEITVAKKFWQKSICSNSAPSQFSFHLGTAVSKMIKSWHLINKVGSNIFITLIKFNDSSKSKICQRIQKNYHLRQQDIYFAIMLPLLDFIPAQIFLHLFCLLNWELLTVVARQIFADKWKTSSNWRDT
jgi:hypothetical protein